MKIETRAAPATRLQRFIAFKLPIKMAMPMGINEQAFLFCSLAAIE